VNKRVLIGVCLALSGGAAIAAPSGAGSFPLKASVPEHATAKSFVSRKFKETVTCSKACKVTSKVLIRAKAARQLGFRHVNGKYVVVATNKASLKAKTPTKIVLVPTRQARARLGRAKTVAIFGSVRAVPNGSRHVSYSVGWAASLTR
jgi:hypothetical protein